MYVIHGYFSIFILTSRQNFSQLNTSFFLKLLFFFVIDDTIFTVLSSTHLFLLLNLLICSDINLIVAQKVWDSIFSLYCVPKLYYQSHGLKMNALLSVCCWHQVYISNSDFSIKFYHQICIENYLFDWATLSLLQIWYDLNRASISPLKKKKKWVNKLLTPAKPSQGKT